MSYNLVFIYQKRTAVIHCNGYGNSTSHTSLRHIETKNLSRMGLGTACEDCGRHMDQYLPSVWLVHLMHLYRC